MNLDVTISAFFGGMCGGLYAVRTLKSKLEERIKGMENQIEAVNYELKGITDDASIMKRFLARYYPQFL